MPKMTEEQRQQRALVRARREALAAEEDDRRLEQRQQQWMEQGAYLTVAEIEAGEPCRGCGEPLLDGLGNWPALLHMTPAQRRDYDDADASFRERHSGCRAHRWSMSGNRTAHCGYCCPPPPLSTLQIERIRQILSSVKTEKKDLIDWDLTLTCEHSVRHSQHRDHDRYSFQVVGCPTCGARRGVVATQRIGPAAGPDARAQKEHLSTQLQSAQTKLKRQRKATAATERHNEELTIQFEKADLNLPTA